MIAKKKFFPEKPDVDLKAADIVAFSNCHNEERYLEYFFEYYRRLGVQHFFVIDNASTDATAEIIKSQPDATYFHTTASYRKSASGRLWTQELASHYGTGKWCLTVDADELFVYPGVEHFGLPVLTSYLDNNGYESLFGFFLDLYPQGPLNQAAGEAGEPFLSTSPLFDGEGYVFAPVSECPYISIKGGPRCRYFWKGDIEKSPAMQKQVLVRWKPGFHYLYSTHFMEPVRMADITSAVLHFKFNQNFRSFVDREVSRGDRTQRQDYLQYQNTLHAEASPSLVDENSLRYQGSHLLSELGFMAVTKQFVAWLRSCVATPPDPDFWGFAPDRSDAILGALERRAASAGRAPDPAERFMDAHYLSEFWRETHRLYEDRTAWPACTVDFAASSNARSWRILDLPNRDKQRLRMEFDVDSEDLRIDFLRKYWRKATFPRRLEIEVDGVFKLGLRARSSGDGRMRVRLPLRALGRLDLPAAITVTLRRRGGRERLKRWFLLARDTEGRLVIASRSRLHRAGGTVGADRPDEPSSVRA